MKIILCGYHWTGCKALELLMGEGHEVYVYTHETENCIADMEGLCIRKNIRYSLEKISIDNLPFIPDMICSVYYRWIIQRDVIDAVNGKIFNLHPALLPQYRGCSSLTWAMINGERECGFTYHYIDAGCDTGNIIIQKSIAIEDFDTQLTLYNRVMFESMKVFLEALHLVEEGYPGKKQEGKTSRYKRGCPMDGRLDPSMDREMQERFVRAMCYPPYPAAQYEGREIRTYRELQAEVFRGGNRVIVFGCGGHARSIVNTLYETSEGISIIFVDENAGEDEVILGSKVESEYKLKENDNYIIAIGDNAKRRELYCRLINEHVGNCISIISRASHIGMEIKMGRGTFIAANTYIGPQTEIGNDCIINTSSVIEHEVVIGNHTHIAPNSTICGRAKIGDNVFCGAGSTIKDNISVCNDVVIGAGAVVVKDIDTPGVYVGVPAKKVG